MGSAQDRTRGLLQKARDDLYAAEYLAQGAEASAWTIGFHAQQAIEKAVKAVLMHHEVRYPFTHGCVPDNLAARKKG